MRKSTGDCLEHLRGIWLASGTEQIGRPLSPVDVFGFRDQHNSNGGVTAASEGTRITEQNRRLRAQTFMLKEEIGVISGETGSCV